MIDNYVWETCEHQEQKHTIWYWLEDSHDPFPMPYVLIFDNRRDAVITSQYMINQATPRLRWIKIFRSDNEAYVCFRWSNPKPYDDPVLKIVNKQYRRRPWWKFWR